VSTSDVRAKAFCELVDLLESPASREEPVYTFGSGTARAFDAVAENVGLDPNRAGDLAGRFVDMSPWVRRCGALPIYLYRFDEVAAVARGLPRPVPGTPQDALFVMHAGLGTSAEPAPLRATLEAAGRDSVESLRAIREWLAT
jgi:hypothetical protein